MSAKINKIVSARVSIMYIAQRRFTISINLGRIFSTLKNDPSAENN
jgi:hypothetical protein